MPIITPAITTVFAFQLAGWAYHPPDGDQTCLGYLEESEHREVMGQASGLYGIFPPAEWESEAPFDCTVLIEWSGSVILVLVYCRRIETVLVIRPLLSSVGLRNSVLAGPYHPCSLMYMTFTLRYHPSCISVQGQRANPTSAIRNSHGLMLRASCANSSCL